MEQRVRERVVQPADKTDASRDLVILAKDRRINELEAVNQQLQQQLKVPWRRRMTIYHESVKSFLRKWLVGQCLAHASRPSAVEYRPADVVSQSLIVQDKIANSVR